MKKPPYDSIIRRLLLGSIINVGVRQFRLPQIVRTAQKRACVRLFCSSGEAQR